MTVFHFDLAFAFLSKSTVHGGPIMAQILTCFGCITRNGMTYVAKALWFIQYLMLASKHLGHAIGISADYDLYGSFCETFCHNG